VTSITGVQLRTFIPVFLATMTRPIQSLQRLTAGVNDDHKILPNPHWESGIFVVQATLKSKIFPSINVSHAYSNTNRVT
jgi:hypothetical protein